MKYQVEVLIRNVETGAVNISERTVSLEREKSPSPPHNPLPIDSDQKDRLIRWAIVEATEDAIRNRDKVSRPPMQFTRHVSSPGESK